MKATWKLRITTAAVALTVLAICWFWPHDGACAQGGAAAWSFDAPIGSLTAYGDGFAVLSDGEIWFCNGDNAGSGVPALLSKDDVVLWDLFTNDDGDLYALADTEEGHAVYVLDQQTNQLSERCRIALQNKPAGAPRRVFWHDGRVVLEYAGATLNHSDLFFVDLESGDVREERDRGVSSLTPYGDGALLGLKSADGTGGYVLASYLMDTGRTTDVCELEERPEAFCFDEVTRRMVVFASSNASSLSETGKVEARQYLPVSDASDGRLCAIGKNRLFALSDGDKLLAVDLEKEPNDGRLQIARFNEDGEETKRFRLSHPDIPVHSVNMGYELTPARISQMILGGDRETDIYMVRSFETGYTSLLDKGFCADLSGSRDIASAIMSMPSNLSSAMMRGGQVLGVPVNMEFDIWTTLACNAETLADIGLTRQDIPDSMTALLDCLLEWYRDGTLDQVRLFGFSASDQSLTMIWFLLNHYSYYASAGSDWISYNTPLFETLVEKCDKLIAEMEKHTGISDASPYLFDYVTSDEILLGDESGERLIIPFTPEENMPPCYPATITVAVLNPLSEKKERALAYLSSLVNEMPASVRLYFQPDLAKPVESAVYLERRREAETEIERVNGLLQADETEPEARNDLTARLNELENWVALIEREDRWELSPERIAAYRRIADQVLIPESGITEILDEQTYDMVEQYASGVLDRKDFIQDLIRKANFMRLEGSRAANSI